MAIQKSALPWLMLISFMLVHIVYMGDLPKGEFSAENHHNSMLEDVVGSGASELLLHSYKRSFNGFAAKLTKEEADKLAGMEGVVSVFPSEKKKLLTSRSWDFIGFSQQARRSGSESDIIIGMLDTGIWPESESFSHKYSSPPPKKWKGTCQHSSNFTCNNKIIGAKYYRADGGFSATEFQSPRDSEGHGSHTSSIAAGDLVSTSFYGFRKGTVRGGVPSARIAVYKICWDDGCADEDILAAFDDAIADGVDIISLSVGGIFPFDYFQDPIAIGAFHSMKNGILTSNAAGNTGPIWPVVNVSPWSLSVGASTIDRKFETNVTLGNGKVYTGVSINTFDLEGKFYPLIWGGDAPDKKYGYNSSDSRYCWPGTLDETLVKGKIVLCDALDYMEGPLDAGAVGAIVQDSGYKDFAFTFPLPASFLELTDGSDILQYINTTENPTATIFRSIEENDELAPYVVSFSSRGPNYISMDILKPDIVAPGADILAAWSPATTVTGIPGDKRVVSYNIVSGTSMSCPHATAAAAYVKSFNPTLSPSAIKSALMTTAWPMSPTKNTDLEFAYGAGEINPSMAADPGLVYDVGEIDYVNFLCGQGYSDKHLRLVTGDKTGCSNATKADAWDLNIPSFTLYTSAGLTPSHKFHRTVTNVGPAVSTYKANITAPNSDIDVQVEPSVLSFNSVGEKKSFVVTVTAKITPSYIVSGSLVWDDGVHKVRSPIVCY
ncbi:hypothetical protein COLO4_25555 [Corchorus olitorius]|uniref:Peptidase S8/S53 domain-containing protein n=1 Tax=Corchorus olitorius TaxID=93759 RepID=A0A1R3I1R5_9ROSI|nr:hypothetical protein COLO4_25555 [Corchorus olitorius]